MKKGNRPSVPPKHETVIEPPKREWRWRLAACVVLLLIVGIVYSNSFQSLFVLDNKFIIKFDPRIKDASVENLKLIWARDYWWPKAETGAYRPIVSMTYLLNWSVFGSGKHTTEAGQVVGFHWVNLFAHAVNAMLVFLLMLKLHRGKARNVSAFFTAALFAVHPIATESVTNIIGRADEFAAMMILGATLLYIRSTETVGLRRILWLSGVMVLFGAACLSKELSVAFLAVPLAFDGIYRWGSEQSDGRRVRIVLSDFARYIVLTLPLLGVLFIRSIVFRDSKPSYSLFLDNPISRLDWSEAASLSANLHNWVSARMTACNVALKAFWKLIFPVRLSSDYSYNEIRLFEWQLTDMENIKAIVGAVFIVGTLALAIWCYKRHKAVSFLICFYWITYGPTSNFLVTSTSIMAERFLYLPSIAFCALLVIGVERLATKAGSWPRLLPHGVLLAIVVLFGVRTYVRNLDWRSDVTLAESAVRNSPGSFRSYGTLAEAYHQSDPINKIDRIIEVAEKGIAILEPLPNIENGSSSYMAMGIYYALKGDSVAGRNPDGSLMITSAARSWFEKSARVLERSNEIVLATSERNEIRGAGSMDVYRYLAMVYERIGHNDKALEVYKYMRHLSPRDPDLYVQIGKAEFTLGMVEDALVSLIQCIALAPQRADVWQSIVDVYAQINREPMPAVQVTDGRTQLREDNPMVRRHLLLAYRGFIRIARSSGRTEMVRESRDVAVNHYRFDPALLADVLEGQVERPAPPAPVFHTYGRKL
jgi:tetratricopeptide (TPR) repeat protein